MFQPMMVRKPQPPGEAYTFWSGVALLPLLLPLLAFALLPCTDLPQHLAMSQVAWRLLTGDALTCALFEFNLQPVPYYLLYLVLVPGVGWVGALWAAKLLLMGTAVAWVAAVRRCLRVLDAPAVLLLAVPPIFFGPMFYWGFVASLLGVPGVLCCLAGLLEAQRELGLGVPDPARQAAARRAACGGALWATLAHAPLALPCILLGLAALWATPQRRRLLPLVGAVLCCAGLPLLPAALRAVGAVGEVAWRWKPASVEVQWHYVKRHLGPFDRGLGRAAHEGMLLLAVGLGLWVRRRARQRLLPQWGVGSAAPPEHSRRLLGAALAALLLLYALTPQQLHLGESFGMMLAYRYLALVELWALFYCVPPLRLRGADRRWRRLLAAGLVLGCTVFSTAQWGFFRRFNRAATPRLSLLRGLPSGGAMAVEKVPEAFERSAAPMLLHLTAYYTALHGGAQSDLFGGSHLPIRWQRATPNFFAATAAHAQPTFWLRVDAQRNSSDARLPGGGAWHLQGVEARGPDAGAGGPPAVNAPGGDGARQSRARSARR